MTALKKIIISEIRQKSRISLSRYIELCLYHPHYGYYMKGTPVGKTGAFITAPEVSQIFGELIGLWVVDLWQRMDKPSSLSLVELGPGRGTLMADLLRYTSPIPKFHSALKVHLLEISPTLRQQQQELLKNKPFIQWHDSLESLDKTISSNPIIFIGNEFLDAFPFDQYRFSQNKWFKRFVEFINEDFIETWKEKAPPAGYLNQYPVPQEGNILEYSASGKISFNKVLNIIRKKGGAGLFIDYGYNSFTYGDSFQALHHHTFSNPFQKPGEADLTHHVNFNWYKHLANQEGFKTLPLISQQEFLDSIGISVRAHQLQQKGARQVLQDVHRLTNQMGQLFKVLTIYL